MLITIVAAVFFSIFLLIFIERKSISSIEAKAPALRENGFSAEFNLPCNRFHALEIGFEINPPIKINHIQEARTAISGNVELSIMQAKTKRPEKHIVDLINTGWSYNPGKGLWVKVISRQSATWSFFCSKRKLRIEARDINFDLTYHKVSVYVSRDRRP
ncbi:hypothetical protein ACNQFN_11050 [Thauera butanivorans]|uniref:hypothetical protein n=1 Tax=Thauera butanivorans TaxID=86174 RepID=UPI003AB130E6